MEINSETKIIHDNVNGRSISVVQLRKGRFTLFVDTVHGINISGVSQVNAILPAIAAVGGKVFSAVERPKIPMTQRLENLVGAICFPVDFSGQMNYESDSSASGVLKGKSIAVSRIRKNKFRVSVKDLCAVTLDSELDVNKLLQAL